MVNKTRTIILKIVSVILITGLVNVLANLSKSSQQWYSTPLAILTTILIMYCMLILLVGEVKVVNKEDKDLQD